jgi:hypothetical protein
VTGREGGRYAGFGAVQGEQRLRVAEAQVGKEYGIFAAAIGADGIGVTFPGEARPFEEKPPELLELPAGEGVQSAVIDKIASRARGAEAREGAHRGAGHCRAIRCEDRQVLRARHGHSRALPSYRAMATEAMSAHKTRERRAWWYTSVPRSSR